jgi:hypothetical protein
MPERSYMIVVGGGAVVELFVTEARRRQVRTWQAKTPELALRGFFVRVMPDDQLCERRAMKLS